MSDLVGNPEDRFSRVEAQLVINVILIIRFWLFVPKQYISNQHTTRRVLINSDVTGTVEMDHRSVCFDVRLTEYHAM